MTARAWPRLGWPLIAVAALAALALACTDDDPPAPADPAATATTQPTLAATAAATSTAAPTGTPTAAPTSTATATPSPSPTSTPEATSTPSPTPSPVPTPEPPPVSVAGPLFVFSEGVEVVSEADDHKVERREIVVYDLGSDRHWTAFEYDEVRPSHRIRLAAVQPSGTSLIVWSEGQVRRMTLSGQVEAVLLESDSISEISVSPDGTKVAALLGRQVLRVLDAATGEQVLNHRSWRDPALNALGWDKFRLAGWEPTGNAVGLKPDYYSNHTAIVTLDGDVRVLPADWYVSPNLRYAVRLGEELGWRHHAAFWDKFDLLDVETGDVLWTVTDDEGVHAPTSAWSFWSGQSRYLAFGGYAEGERVLDVVTGEVMAPPGGSWRLLAGRVLSFCGVDDSIRRRPWPCDVSYGGRVVWEGATGWTHYLGLIEPPKGFTLRVARVEAPPEPTPPPPPSFDEVVGPVLLYEVDGEYEYEGQAEAFGTRRVIAYDEGSERGWPVVSYRGSIGDYLHGDERVQAALRGMVGALDFREGLTYLSLDGQAQTLTDDWTTLFRVSPDGRMVAADYRSGPVIVLDVPSGDVIARLDFNEAIAAVEPDVPSSLHLSSPGWTSDSAAFLFALAGASGHGGYTGGGIVTLDGAVRRLPCTQDPHDPPTACLSPDGRHIVRGRDADTGEYTSSSSERWGGFDIIDFASGDVLWAVEALMTLYDRSWEWAEPGRFAWSDLESGAFRFDRARPNTGGRTSISVLDVASGEIEVMGSEEYLARYRPAPRATTDCPDHPARACRILLDGEPVGEGRWPRIIGFVDPR